MNNRGNVFRYLTLISQFGINMLVPIFLCSFVGMWLDRKLHTSFLMILLFFVGALAGFRNVYLLAMRMNRGSNEKDASERKEF